VMTTKDENLTEFLTVLLLKSQSHRFGNEHFPVVVVVIFQI